MTIWFCDAGGQFAGTLSLQSVLTLWLEGHISFHSKDTKAKAKVVLCLRASGSTAHNEHIHYSNRILAINLKNQEEYTSTTNIYLVV